MRSAEDNSHESYRGEFTKSSTLNVSLKERKNEKTCNKLAKYDTNYLNASKAREFNQKLSYLCNCP